MSLAKKLRRQPRRLAARCSRRRRNLTAGDSDPLVAVDDALREFEAEEVVVVTRPNEEASWLEEGKGREIAEKIHDVPLRRIELYE
jgi:hypothetical protein